MRWPRRPAPPPGSHLVHGLENNRFPHPEAQVKDALAKAHDPAFLEAEEKHREARALAQVGRSAVDAASSLAMHAVHCAALRCTALCSRHAQRLAPSPPLSCLAQTHPPARHPLPPWALQITRPPGWLADTAQCGAASL